MRRKRGLDQYFAPPALATRAAGNLHDRLCQAFVGAKVGAEQTLVGVDDADQRQFREVVAFRQHLGTDQDVGLTFDGLGQSRPHRAFRLGAVAVDTPHPAPRKPCVQRSLQPLGAGAERPDLGAALATGRIQGSAGTAVMTPEPGFAGMDGHPRVAACTFGDVAAGGADQRRREAPPVQVQKCLSTGREMPLDRIGQYLAQTFAVRIQGQVHELDTRRPRGAGPARQGQMGIPAVPAV